MGREFYGPFVGTLFKQITHVPEFEKDLKKLGSGKDKKQSQTFNPYPLSLLKPIFLFVVFSEVSIS